MAQSFDDIKINNCAFKFYSNDYYAGFEAGAQSKQAEIDEYKMVAESMEDVYLSEKSKVDELRKRIDEAIERSNHAHIGYQMLYKQFNDVINILKGITND